MLFVITGASLPLPALVTGAAGGIAIVAARLAAKLAGVMFFAPLGGLRVRQAVGLGCALMPMSTLALMLQHHVVQQYPAFGPELAASVLAAVIVMEIAGPIAVQWGLQLAGETEPDARPPAPESPGKPGATARSPDAPGFTSLPQALTFGVELELMVLNTARLQPRARSLDLLARLEKVDLEGE